MYRTFKIQKSFQVPDGTILSPFLNPKDAFSDLPWDLFDGFSMAAGEVKAGTRSKIHLMPLVTHVTFVRSGQLVVRMKDQSNDKPYNAELSPGQAALTLPGTFIQHINNCDVSCHTLYIVSPQYLFVDDAQLFYDDSIVLQMNWEELAECNWCAEMDSLKVLQNRRRAAMEHLIRIKAV